MGVNERMTIDVKADMAEAMRRSLAGGAYQSENDIIDHALRDWARLQQSDAEKLGWLRDAVEVGRQGPGIPAEVAFAGVRARIEERFGAK